MIYLDNCSTTKMREEVLEYYVENMKENFANPSSLHSLGVKSEGVIKESRKTIANLLNVNANEIYFTSGGTESNNIAIQSIINRNKKRGGVILTSSVEHSSVQKLLEHFNSDNIRVEKLSVDSHGVVDIGDLEDKLNDDVFLVSVMQVNNELGSIQPIEEIGRLIKKRSKAVFHVDGVQGYMKVPTNLKNIDLYSASGHKIHAPKGIGLLYAKSSLNLQPIIIGGGQEKNLRSGTENLNAISAFAYASQVMAEKKDAEVSHIKVLKLRLKEEITAKIDDIIINTPDESSPYILSVSFKGIRAEVLLHYLEQDEIYISTSSACNSKGHGRSHVLEAIKIPNEYAEGTVRICFSYANTFEQIDIVVEKLVKYINELRSLKKR